MSGNARAGRTYALPSRPSAGGKGATAERRRSRKGEGEQAARPQRRRQRGQQAKRKRGDPAADEDRQRNVVELRRVVGHLVGWREKRHKVEAMVVNTATAAGASARATAKPTGMRKRPRAKQKAGKVSSAGSTANFIDSRAKRC